MVDWSDVMAVDVVEKNDEKDVTWTCSGTI
jgi:hypothetical protein